MMQVFLKIKHTGQMMRKIGTLSNKQEVADFQSYLFFHGIETHNYEDSEDFDVWVIKDEQRHEAKSLLVEFRNTNRASLDTAIKKGREQAEQKVQAQEAKDKRLKFINARTSTFNSRGFQIASVTGFLIGACVLVFLMTDIARIKEVYLILSYSIPIAPPFFFIEKGQVWRLITPIFLHGGIWHIFFNMAVLYKVGPVIEKREGPWFFSLMVFIIAIISNTIFAFLIKPYMIGISGVLFGLIAYAWAYYRVNSNASSYFEIQSYARSLVIWCLICFVLKMTDLLSIANLVHTTGALVGVILGFTRAFMHSDNSVPISWLWRNNDNRIAILIIITLTVVSIFVDNGFLKLTF